MTFNSRLEQPTVHGTSNPTDPAAAAELLPLVYDQLRGLAVAFLRRERPDHTLQPTALVHEAYMKLADQARVAWKDRAHFFSVAAVAIRRVLVDHARGKRAGKRMPPGARVTLAAEQGTCESSQADLLDIDAALRRLAEVDPRRARVVELRFFGGLNIEEVAAALDVSEGTVKNDWRLARAWLQRELSARNSA